MTNVRNILQKKGSSVWSIAPSATILDALNMMAEKNVGALLVMEDDHLIGIFSERDYARRGVLKGNDTGTQIKTVMTSGIYYVQPDQVIEECMAIMTNKHIRHLPVVENEKVIGVISIGDVVNSIIDNQRDMIRGLENYIMGGTYEGDAFIR